MVSAALLRVDHEMTEKQARAPSVSVKTRTFSNVQRCLTKASELSTDENCL